MKIISYAAALLIGGGVLAACSGSGGNQQTGSSAKATVAGKVADGYLANAVVFLDKNNNYQLDAGEPNSVTDAGGAFTLSIDSADAGKYPIVVLAIKDQTVDLDTNTAVTSTYVLSMHAVSVTPATSGTVSGTVSNFISPISTLIRETLEANPGMTLSDAITQVRSQLNLPSDIKVQGDYVFGSMSGARKSDYDRMHRTAQAMAGLMEDQSAVVMVGKAPQIGRYREMVGQIGNNLPQITDTIDQGGDSSSAMAEVRAALHNSIIGMPSAAPFRNISSLFNNMTSHRVFWNMSGGKMRPRHWRGATSTSGTTATTTTTTTTTNGGATLYAQYCAGCHGALASSGIRTVGAPLISSAISSIGSMKSISLTSAQITAIATALNF